MELQENKVYTVAELAEWFKITQKTFSNTRAKRLEMLKVQTEQIHMMLEQISLFQNIQINLLRI